MLEILTILFFTRQATAQSYLWNSMCYYLLKACVAFQLDKQYVLNSAQFYAFLVLVI